MVRIQNENGFGGAHAAEVAHVDLKSISSKIEEWEWVAAAVLTLICPYKRANDANRNTVKREPDPGYRIFVR
jgi:hypothetical protein